MRKTILLLSIVFFLFTKNIFAQSDSSAKPVFSGYVDGYYGYYTDSVGAGNYQKFPSVSPRTGFGLNTAMITGSYDGAKVRGIISLQFGDIAKSAWSGTFNNIMEAHAGLKLCEKIWLDAGFFRTHFGTEGLLPKENIASSISIGTWYEPYFESGFRLNYNPSDKLAINLFVLNGYNMYEDNNSKKSIGALITYALSDKGNIGYSNYIGDDSPDADTVSHLCIHNNLFWNYKFGKLQTQIGGDYCMQENADTTGTKSASMFSGVLGLKYWIKDNWSVYTREEVFQDEQGFMSGVFTDTLGKQTGIKMWGATLGLEYKPTANSYVRLEARQLQFDDAQAIFWWNKKAVANRMEMMFHMGISF